VGNLANSHSYHKRDSNQCASSTVSIKSFKFSRSTKISVFWDIKPCSQFKVKWPFGEICRLLLQGRRISQRRKQSEAGSKTEQILHRSKKYWNFCVRINIEFFSVFRFCISRICKWEPNFWCTCITDTLLMKLRLQLTFEIASPGTSECEITFVNPPIVSRRSRDSQLSRYKSWLAAR
jgi:hypothetical protein